MNYLKGMALVATLVSSYRIPDNLQEIYDNYKSRECNNKLATGFLDGGSRDSPHPMSYCGDIDGAIYLHTSRHGGSYANMDIDCDGANNAAGVCGDDQSGQSQTAFVEDVAQYGIADLDAHIHPYVVFGNQDIFDPQQYGMEPLSVMAVVCNRKLFYGIWGDINGANSTGEASLSMGQLCFPNASISGDHGHQAQDVLYLGFIGGNAVPGRNASWNAENVHEFEKSIKPLGDELVAGLHV
ncbi:hypothetical protein FE257_000066 [Aspergillus nanangensis]|uniref:Endo-chitosanase n=1 Tax=Aspergillus nanangensis TaxID=2582783 RepID=A0AAD4CYT3_ASPNN|nr:hypothetical protein FE257_000066 [Aspergillus nanangensis]